MLSHVWGCGCPDTFRCSSTKGLIRPTPLSQHGQLTVIAILFFFEPCIDIFFLNTFIPPAILYVITVQHTYVTNYFIYVCPQNSCSHSDFWVLLSGFMCFKCYFENVNQFEHRLKKSGGTYVSSHGLSYEYYQYDCLWTVDYQFSISIFRCT